jgi:hypothetical protein
VSSRGLPTGPCPDPLDITRAVSQARHGAVGEPLRAHLDACPACRQQWQSESEMARLARQLAREVPAELPAADRRRLLASTVAAARASGIRSVGDARPPTRGLAARWGAWVALGAAAGITLLLGVRALWAPAAPVVALVRPPAVIDARPGTRYTVLAGPPHERVRLEVGSLRISVEPATRGETFQVVTARGEVEVRGTVFETVASAAGLVAVRVERGKVVVRPDRGQELAVPAGGEWRRPPEAPPPITTPPALAVRRSPGRPLSASSAHAAAGAPTSTTRSSPPPPPSPSRSLSWGPDRAAPSGAGVLRRSRGDGSTAAAAEDDTPDQLAAEAFGDGMALLRAGSLAQAARAFERVASLSPASPMVEDARYWRAVALARGGNKAAAEVALDGFLTDYPLSPRAGEVSVMLGWLLLDGRPAAAEPRFRAGLGDRSPRVQQSARDGLAALRSAPGRP